VSSKSSSTRSQPPLTTTTTSGRSPLGSTKRPATRLESTPTVADSQSGEARRCARATPVRGSGGCTRAPGHARDGPDRGAAPCSRRLAGSERWTAAFRLAAFAGLRLGEIRGVRWQDVDLEAGTITVGRSLLPDGTAKRTTRDRPRAGADDPGSVDRPRRRRIHPARLCARHTRHRGRRRGRARACCWSRSREVSDEAVVCLAASLLTLPNAHGQRP
jgi:hypothetical protein